MGDRRADLVRTRIRILTEVTELVFSTQGTSIRRRILLVFLFGIVLPTVAAGWLSHRVVTRILRDQAHESQERVLSDLARTLGTLQESSSRQVAALAASPAVMAACSEEAPVPDELFRTFLRLNPEWVDLILFDRRGRLIWSSDGEPSSLTDDELFDLFFAAVRSPRIQTPVTDREGSRTTRLAFQVGTRDSLAGVLAATLDLAFLEPVLSRARVTDDLRAVLWDDRGLIFGTNLHPEELARLRDQIDVLAGGETSEVGFSLRHRRVRLGNETHLLSMRRIPEKIQGLEPTPGDTWFMAVAVPEGRAFASLRRYQLSLAAGVLFAFAGAGVFLVWVGKGVSSPLARMAGFAERIAGGERRERLEEARDDEVGRLARALDDMAASLDRYEQELVRQEGMAVMGRMSALVAHEIRNPLNAMKGSVQLLQLKMPEEPVLQEQAELLLDRIHHLARFVEQLLQTARLPPPRIERVAAREVVQTAWQPLREAAAREGMELSLSGGEVELEVDREQIVELVQNLAANSLEAMADGGGDTFAVSIDNRETEATVTFRDDGPGIPPEVVDDLFRPFTTTKRRGTGLGLVLCRMVAENHGGSLELIPSEVGACFRLVLPRGDG